MLVGLWHMMSRASHGVLADHELCLMLSWKHGKGRLWVLVLGLILLVLLMILLLLL